MRVEASLRDDGTIGRLRAISDDDLLQGLSELLGRSRRIEWELVAHIGEVEDRRLYAREAKPSMFAYCTDVLHLSEQEAYLRIAVARASREHPTLLAMLEDGRLHLSGIARLAPHLTQANRDVLLARATHKSKRQIEELIAEVAPAPDVPPSVRKLPERCGVETATTRDDAALLPRTNELGPDRVDAPLAPAPAGRPVVQPLAPARYKIQFTAGAAFCEKLERLTSLMRSTVPDGDLALILEAAVSEKLERLEAKRFGRAKESQAAQTRPDTKASSSRYVPAAVRRTVHERDGGRCRYVDEQGRRCGTREWLEFHHVEPWALGGATSVENLRLVCRTHNAYLAERDYGRDFMAKHRRGSTRERDATAARNDSGGIWTLGTGCSPSPLV